MSYLKSKKRVVVKLGSSTLTHRTGRLNIRRVEQLVKNIADLHNAGHEIIIVSSGSIALGVAKLGLMERPKDTPSRQACAAVGQCELMYLYDKLFSDYGLTVAQVLLTKYILIEDRRINVQNALERLIQQGVIPIVNENDTVAIDELELEVGGERFSCRNGSFYCSCRSAYNNVRYRRTLRQRPQAERKKAELIPVVEEITDEIRALAGGAGTKLGTGGMITKINAAEIAVNSGIDMIILNGKNPDNLYYLF